MAVAHAFSPKEFKVAIVSDATNAGATGIGSTMNQLDVDSISMPSLNVNQVLDVKSGSNRTFKKEDFFQDNKMRVSEISISGTLHNDAGHKLLLQNICNDVADDIEIPTSFSPASQVYGSAVANSASSLTLVIQPSDVTNQRGIEMFGCVVTSFNITADVGTEGGRYKFSATLQTGKKPDLESTATPTITSYSNTDIPSLVTSSAHNVSGSDVVMNSFGVTVEHPAVFTGVTSDGYEVVSRGAEIAVTAETSIKYDGNTKNFIHEFDTQTIANTDGNFFAITNNNAFGINMQNGVFTDVTFNEGDIMMLDCSIKSIDDGTDPLITFDVSA